MKNLKKMIAAVTIAGVIGAGGAIYASEAFKTPVQITSELTGKSIEDLNEERAAGKTYGTIAKDAGKLEAFKAEMLKQKKAILDERVKSGVLTQEKADEIYNAIKKNQEVCDGEGTAQIGKQYGAGFGLGCSSRQFGEEGLGLGQGRGMGCGRGLNK